MKLFLFLLPLSVFSADLKDFSTDYCTLFPEGTFKKPRAWANCCLEHDLVYWAGGTQTMQDLSDIKLGECVTSKSSKFYGKLMYNGVRLGHYSPIKNKTKWGHGWGDDRGFQPLTSDEKLIIIEQVHKALINTEYKANYLNLYIKN